MRFLSLLILLLGSSLFGWTQPKTIQAIKSSQAPIIDGSLDDAAWQSAPIATDFITNTPVFGKPASAKTIVKVIYDNNSIYIGAYLYDDPNEIRRQFTLRDDQSNANVDYFSVFLDTYKDRQNAFQFQVSARNVQTDTRVSPQYATTYGSYGDVSWDAVWDSKVSMKADGWVVEMRIPYFAIRFPKSRIQDWGIQFLRFSKRYNEASFWNPVNPNQSGFANQFGDLQGLDNILPPPRLSFSPYVSGGYRETPTISNGRLTERLSSGGMDVKYGISESFTLDATLIPDFGQVISDNVVNNISPYEIQFRENRPFFTEGTELFNKAGMFYSRRVGSTPSRFEEINESVNGGAFSGYSILKNPSVTKLYNALKFSGRTKNNLGIGIFNAVTQPVYAKLRNNTSGKDTSVLTEPLTNYNVIVFDQALKNRSYITFTNTNVIRNGNQRDANVTGVDMAFYDKNNKFGITLSPRYSKVFDENGGYDGFKNYIEIGKVSGKFQYSLSNNIESAQYDPNDLGFLYAPNENATTLKGSYNIFEANKYFLNQSYSLSIEQSYLYKPFEYQKTSVVASAFVVFKNFWDLTLSTEVQPFWFNDFFELQTPSDIRATPRVKLKKARNYFIGATGSSDSRKRLYVSWDLGFAESPNPNDPFYSAMLETRFRFSDRFTVSASFQKREDHGQFGYSFLRDPFNSAPILARRKYLDATALVTGTYSFTSRMNLSFRARHFWNRIKNTNFYNVKPDGYWTERFDYNPSDYNYNYNAFNLDVFYTWDFRLGSRLIVGWKNWLARDYEFFINENQFPGYTQNAGEIWNTPHGNEITVRFIYFLDSQRLLGKKKPF